jgi:hypothetical protein
VSDDAGAVAPEKVLSRCVAHAWQTLAGSTCEPQSRVECTLSPVRDVDGECCVELRNCQHAFCDGQRWWTRR